MEQRIILAPVRYPLKDPSIRTVRRARDIAAHDDAHLYVLHVNLVYKDEDVRRDDLRRAVEGALGPLPNASYHVREAFLLEEAILNEAVNQDADCIVIGRDTKARWRQLLASLIDTEVDLGSFLKREADAELVVV